jgi:hypothetical protein
MIRTFFVCFAILSVFIGSEARAALPEPPKQREPWQPPATSLPDYVVKVTAQLFSAGLADPRGGAYRKVEIFGRQNGEQTVETHAWLFPGDLAVCWNGLVYRAKTAGDQADLGHDIDVILTARPWAGRRPSVFRARDDSPHADASFWSAMETNSTIVPASIALLLRLGRADLAEKLWAAPEEPSFARKPVGPHENEEGLWLATAATAWFATAYWRVVGAFQAADDLEAADVGESILQWRSRVPDAWEVENRSAPRRVPDISFMSPVPQLAADARRRLSEPRQTGLSRQADLVNRLQDVVGTKISWPGPLVFAFDSIYSQLVNEGDAVVPALIEAYENDHRLTRTFDFGRPWNIDYKPIAVHHVVELILTDLIGASVLKEKSPADLRAWWRDSHAVDRPGRGFDVLADDHATPAQWLENADYLTSRSDIQKLDGGGFTMQSSSCEPGKPVPSLKGEPLRSRTNPSLTDLLSRRTSTLANQGSSLACAIAVKLALWDEKAALASLRLAAKLPTCRADYKVAIARLSLGDEGAASDWVNELPHHPRFPPLTLNDLSPFWMFPRDPVLEQAAQSMFENPGATWAPLKVSSEINSPLLAVPAFQRALLAALDDATEIGEASRREDGTLEYHFKDGGGGGGGASGHDSRQAKPGEDRRFRAKDLVALGVSSIEGAPEFGLDWTSADKDAALPVIKRFLEEHSAEARVFPSHLREMDCFGRLFFVSAAK